MDAVSFREGKSYQDVLIFQFLPALPFHLPSGDSSSTRCSSTPPAHPRGGGLGARGGAGELQARTAGGGVSSDGLRGKRPPFWDGIFSGGIFLVENPDFFQCFSKKIGGTSEKFYAF